MILYRATEFKVWQTLEFLKIISDKISKFELCRLASDEFKFWRHG